MLTLTAAQWTQLARAALGRFESEMVAHCHVFSPRLSSLLGDDTLRAVVAGAVQRAAKHGLTHRGPLRLWVELTLLFGSEFDTDPQYPWVARTLAVHAPQFQMQRAERVYEQTIHYLDTVVGPDDKLARQSLERMAMMADAAWWQAASGESVHPLHLAALIYPEKAKHVGDDALLALARAAVEEARAHGLDTRRHALLMCVLMFAFGHGCTRDPLYPWIANTLRADRGSDPQARALALERKAVIWLKRVLAGEPQAAPA